MATFDRSRRPEASSTKRPAARGSDVGPSPDASTLLMLQRTAGNAAVVHALGQTAQPAVDTDVIRRFAVLRTRKDLGYDDDDAGDDWWQETVELVQYVRLGLSYATKAAVDAFGDGQAHGTYKHYVPSKLITDALIDMIGGSTREVVHGNLAMMLEEVGIDDTSGLDETSNKVAFDAWCSWVIDAIADMPENIYRWTPSSGDGAGTTLDVPAQVAATAVAVAVPVPAALTARIQAVADTLHDALGTPH